jgi:D-glycero-alpha-D-manno-heptose 1-phosphate guanylyltransferase
MPKISICETDVLILCGGLGTRFREVENNIPKALAPINGTPFIDLLLNDLVDQGFRRIILATGHLSSKLEQYVKGRKDAEYIISFESKPMGTGGAIKLAERHIRSDIFLILNGDTHIQLGYSHMINFHLQMESDFTICLSNINDKSDFGSVCLNNKKRIISFNEKKNINNSLANAGVYCVNKKLLNNIEKNIFFSAEKYLIPKWLKKYKIFGYETNLQFYDIGTKDRYISYINMQKK